MARKKKIRLGKHSRLNMLKFPAKAERVGDQFLVYCFNGPARAYVHDWFGSPVTFKSIEDAESFIQSYK